MSLAEEVEREIKSKSKLENFVTPCYEGYSIANIPPTILSIFKANLQGCKSIPKRIIKEHLDGIRKVVLLVVDSMGYKQFFSHSNEPISKILMDGSMIPLTSTFPSTSTTALTTLNTGATPQEHGIIGYTMYVKEYGLVANMVSFTPTYDYRWETLLKGFDPREFLGIKNIHDILNEKGIKSYVINRYADTGLSRMHHTGATVSNYMNSSDLFVTLRKLLESEIGTETYTYVYWGLVDTMCHIYGPRSEEALAELGSFLYSYKTEFLDKLKPDIAKETLLMITADHGQSEVFEETTIFASDHPELMNKLWIPPTGDSRAIFLYVEPEEIDKAKEYIDSKLKDKLLLLDSSKAIEEGLFGTVSMSCKERIHDRVGDLIMVPYANYSFSYYARGSGKGFMKGSHGGLSEDEMLVPFICKKLKP
ncbi:MAG: alkaline phosphatase family protein [archaeon]|nr:alkaline phosphatase family protein [archaeon]MCP8305765.1 alkaline phosphatase family protein [archaeon]